MGPGVVPLAPGFGPSFRDELAPMSLRELRQAQLKNLGAKNLYIKKGGQIGMHNVGWAQLTVRQREIKKALEAKTPAPYRQNNINLLGELNQHFATAKVRHNVSDLSETKDSWYSCKTCKDTGKVKGSFFWLFSLFGSKKKKPCPR